MDTNFIIGLSIFLITYALILSEKINRTTVAMFGAIVVLIFNVESQEQAIHSIDFNTIFLLLGMMIIVGIMKKTGIFEYVAIKAAKSVKGNPLAILVLFSVITALSSAFLDNVTTILLMAPVTIVIARELKINPVPLIVSEVLLSNIGGAATLIGDPPNIMIGSSAKIGFNDFLINLGPIVIIIVFFNLIILKKLYKNSLDCTEEARASIMKMDENLLIKDASLLKKSLFVLGLTICGFLTHQLLGYESATVALFGAALLLLVSKADPEEILDEIEWPTIFFFSALFILVGSLEQIGVIEYLAKITISLTKGDLNMTVMLILWVSALASAFLDNIPFVATMIPIIKDLGKLSGMDTTPLWWALALGACLGGNGTLIGASANVIASGLLNKNNYKFSFIDYMKIGFPLMILSIVFASGYLYFRFL